MFKTFKTLDDGYNKMWRFSIMVMVGSIVLCGLVVFQTTRNISKASDRIYVLANGKALEAIAGSRKDNLPIEARDHIRSFHELFFSMEPDELSLDANIKKASYLADGSAKKLYDDFRERGYLAGIISGNVSQRTEVDSVALDLNSYPYRWRCYATERITRVKTVTTRVLITEGWLRLTERTENNGHGFLIEKLQVLDNRDLRTENRGI